MIKCVQSGMGSRDLTKALSIFNNWDYKFGLESSAATLFMAWENAMSYYFHETTIDSSDVRLSL